MNKMVIATIAIIFTPDIAIAESLLEVNGILAEPDSAGAHERFRSTHRRDGN
jgi:hypothetical protein